MLLALFFTLVFILVTACGVNQESEYGYHEDRNGTRFIDNRTDKLDNRQDRNVREITNQNPNFPNLTNSMENTSTTMGVYEDKAREVVNKYTEYDADEVWINGEQMWVTAHTRKEMNTAQIDKEEAKLKKRLEKAIPRYNVNVKITER